MILRTALIALAGLVLGTAAHAMGPGPQAEARYRSSRQVGTIGMAMGYSGPVLVTGGAVVATSGLLRAVGAGIAGDTTTTSDDMLLLAGGGAAIVGGLAFNTAGSVLLASGSLLGGSAVRMGGGQVATTAGWVAAAGAGVHLASRYGLLAGGGPGLLLAGGVGWGAAMIAGTIQHTQNRLAWDSIGVAPESVARRKRTVSLAPTWNGAALVGTF